MKIVSTCNSYSCKVTDDIQTFAVFCMLYVFFWVIPRRLNLYADVSEHSVCTIFIGR
jgi:hypothetical protein